MQEFLDFLTSTDAPWWSALVGILAGGLLTYFTTHRSVRLQAENDRKKAEVEREHQVDGQWRFTAVSYVAELLAAHFRYLEYAMVTKREVNKQHPDSETRNLDNPAYASDLADALGAKGLALMSELQRIYSLIEITIGGSVAQAARNLILKDNEHRPELTQEEFEKTRGDCSLASAILMAQAKKRLSTKQDGQDPLLDHLIATAESVNIADAG